MTSEIFERILSAFERCQSHGKPLELSVDEDLVKIIPLPHKLLLDIVCDEPINAISSLSNDQTRLIWTNHLTLCPIEQRQSGSCHSSTCKQLHICENYILKKICVQFQSRGQCSHSHSLATNHNETILKKFTLSSQDEQVFHFISRLTQLTSSSNQSKLIVETVNKQTISDDLINQWLGEHKSFLIDQKRINSSMIELTFDDAEITSMIKEMIIKYHSTTAIVRENLPSDVLPGNNIRRPPFKIIPMSKKHLSNSTNDKDLDREVQLTTAKTLSTFSNQLKRNDFNSNLNKSSPEQSISIVSGRGRGRQVSNILPNAPSFLTKNSLMNRSPQTNTQPFSRNLSSSNDQLSSIESSSSTEKKLSFSHRLNPKLNEQMTTKSPNNSSSSTPELMTNQLNKSSESPSSRYPLPKQNNETQNSSPNDATNGSSTFGEGKSTPRFVLRENSLKKKETNSITTLITYTYTKPFTDEQLCYLLGPGREDIRENDQCQIISCLPSGYCRLTKIEQGKEIERDLYSILPKTLNTEAVKINDDLALLICSSAAEKIFQQNQIHYAIVSRPCKVPLTIEVIDVTTTERSPLSPRNATGSFARDKITDEQSSSDGKFHIKGTGSSIDVVSGDISQISVDMMICISTSNNLRDSVLHQAGSKIQSQYRERSHGSDPLLLDGGLTAAETILFVPWETDIQGVETKAIQQSLSELVKWCIDQAHGRNMRSISFPPIGTGQLSLDPGFVCEAMISAASERLHQYQIDVVFVSYSSTGINEDDECYQIFRSYLDSLCEQVGPRKSSASAIHKERQISKNFETKKQIVRRDIQSKRLLTISNSPDMTRDHNFLIKSLEKLIYEKTFDLSLIEPNLINQIDHLIDICLQSNVYPRIDRSREEFILRGDRDSCWQCLFNFRRGKQVHRYSYVFTERGEKSDEQIFNSYISLKIDEAFAVGETNIQIEDDEQMSFKIDLEKLQIQTNQNQRKAFLVKKPLNVDSKIKIPSGWSGWSGWSSSSLMICTIEMKTTSYESLECFQVFQETMSISDWQIDRIDSIENLPLYTHFMTRKRGETKLYFHGCSYSSVQSIIHYGFHLTNTSNYSNQLGNRSICFTRDGLNSHLYGTRRATDGKHYLFAVQVAQNSIQNNECILLSNQDVQFVLPTHLIVYQRRQRRSF